MKRTEFIDDIISEYIDPRFSIDEFGRSQKMVIEKAIEENIPKKDIRLIASPDFNANQMLALLKGFERGVPYNIIKEMADPGINYIDMNNLINNAIEHINPIDLELNKSSNRQIAQGEHYQTSRRMPDLSGVKEYMRQNDDMDLDF